MRIAERNGPGRSMVGDESGDEDDDDSAVAAGERVGVCGAGTAPASSAHATSRDKRTNRMQRDFIAGTLSLQKPGEKTAWAEGQEDSPGDAACEPSCQRICPKKRVRQDNPSSSRILGFLWSGAPPWAC